MAYRKEDKRPPLQKLPKVPLRYKIFVFVNDSLITLKKLVFSYLFFYLALVITALCLFSFPIYYSYNRLKVCKEEGVHADEVAYYENACKETCEVAEGKHIRTVAWISCSRNRSVGAECWCKIDGEIKDIANIAW